MISHICIVVCALINIISPKDIQGYNVLDIIQDKYGYMWIATDNGLILYDANAITIFKNSTSDTASLSNNCITCLSEDKYGSIWIGTKKGLNKYNRKSNNFTRYTNRLKPKSIKSEYIRALHSDLDGMLWIDCADGTLVKYNIVTKQSISSMHELTKIEGEYYYDHIFEDSKGRIWIGGRCIRAQRVTNKGNLNIEVVPNKEIDYMAACYAQTSDGEIICSDHKGNLYKYLENDNELLKFTNIPSASTCAATDKNGIIWIGGTGTLVKLEKNSSISHDISENKYKIKQIPINESECVNCIYTDADNNVWIGKNNGVSIIANTNNYITRYSHKDISNNNSRITALTTDSDNLLWIGTENDGVDTLNLATGESGNIKYSLLSKEADRSILRREHYALEQYKKHDFKAKDGRTINENNVSSLYVDSKNNIYIGLWSHVGFNIYNKKSKQMSRYALWSEKPTMLLPNLFVGNLFGANWYSAFLEDSRHRLWCATWESIGLNLFDTEHKCFTGDNLSYKETPLIAGHISLCRDVSNNILYFTCGSSYGYYSPKENKFYRYSNIFPDSYPNAEIYRKYYDKMAHIPISMPVRTRTMNMIGNGAGINYILSDHYLFKHDTKNNNVKVLKNNHSLPWESKIVANNTFSTAAFADGKNFYLINLSNDYIELVKLGDGILSLCFDTDPDILYIGTANGLFRYSIKEKKLHKVEIDGYTCGRRINSIYINNSKIYLGTNKGAVLLTAKYDNPDKYSYRQASVALSDYSINNVDAGGSTSGTLISISTDLGLFFMDSKLSKTLKSYTYNSKNPFSISSNIVKQTLQFNDSIYFVHLNDKPLQLLNINNDRFLTPTHKETKSIRNRLASCVIEDSDGNIWYGTTEDGLDVINIDSGRVRHYGCYEWDDNSLPSNNINCIKEDKSGNIWIGTTGGLYYINRKEKPIFSNLPNLTDYFKAGANLNNLYKFNTESIGERIPGFEETNVLSLEFDLKDRLWISTANGLFCLFPQKNRIIRIPSQLGFISDSWSKSASCLIRDGRLAFGNAEGAFVFYPDTLLSNIRFPKIILGNFAHDNNKLTLTLSSREYIAQECIKYRYRLKDEENDWTYTAPHNLSVRYTNLSYGLHILEIQCSNIAGEWPPVSTLVSVKVPRPFYATFWFYLLLLIIFAMCIYCFIKWRENKLKADKRALEVLVNLRTNELKAEVDSKNKFFSIVSHDLKNPMCDLSMVSKILKKNYDSFSDTDRIKYIDLIENSSNSMSGLLNDILLWALSQQKLIRPNYKKEDLCNIIQQVINCYSMQFAQKEISINNNIPEGTIITTDSNLLSTIIRNLMVNAIKYTPRGGCIKAYITEKGSTKCFAISDNGVGMSVSTMESLFRIEAKLSFAGTEGEKGSGFGLILAHELVKKLNQEIFVESTINKNTTFYVSYN